MSVRAEPLIFGPSERPLAGWVHRANTGADGLVICNPFGYEAICSHRSLRHLAEMAALAGIPTLRYDHDGTGDSAGDDLDPDRLGAWIEGVSHACLALHRRCGVQRTWLLGVRLGALIAALAAPAAAALGEIEIAGLIAIAPVIAGRGFLRELRARQMTLGLRSSPALTLQNPAPGEEDAEEAVGFAITARTKAALSTIDLTAQTPPPARRVLVLDREDLPSADKWVAHLRGQGVEVDARRVPGYVEMMLDPHHAVMPDLMLQTAVSWIQSNALPVPPRDIVAAPLSAAKAGDPRAEARMGAAVECPVHIDPGGRIFGVLSTPPPGVAPSHRAVLLLNAGAIHHIGPNRLYVRLARRLAGTGDSVLRLDLTGIGDSPARPGEPENVVYGPQALADVHEAVAWLRRQPGVDDVRMVGLCSGAYHALKAAVAGDPVNGIVAINPLTFFWTPDQPLDAPAFRVAEEAERYGKSVFDKEKWKKLLRGDVNLAGVTDTMTRHLASVVVNGAQEVSRRLGIRWKDDLGAELAKVAGRRIDLRFVFASGDPGLALLRGQGGSIVPRLRQRGELTIDLIDGPDHTFTPVWSHETFVQTILAALGSAAR